MLHKEIIGLVLLGFLVWIAFAITPNSRLERACKPINWVGNVVVSGTSLLSPKYQADMKRWWDKFDYGCQYSLWRLFYQDDYNKAVAEQAAKEAQAQAQTGKTPATTQQKVGQNAK